MTLHNSNCRCPDTLHLKEDCPCRCGATHNRADTEELPNLPNPPKAYVVIFRTLANDLLSKIVIADSTNDAIQQVLEGDPNIERQRQPLFVSSPFYFDRIDETTLVWYPIKEERRYTSKFTPATQLKT